MGHVHNAFHYHQPNQQSTTTTLLAPTPPTPGHKSPEGINLRSNLRVSFICQPGVLVEIILPVATVAQAAATWTLTACLSYIWNLICDRVPSNQAVRRAAIPLHPVSRLHTHTLTDTLTQKQTRQQYRDNPDTARLSTHLVVKQGGMEHRVADGAPQRGVQVQDQDQDRLQ